jgi:Tfp pilus assembly PilM family ATPase
MSKTPLVGSTFFGLDLSTVVERLWTLRRQVSKRYLLLEFGSNELTLAEATLGLVEVHFDHIRRVELPDKAVDRGVPADPKQMAALLRELCKEERIPAHRAAVVLPPEAAFNKVVALPAAFTPEEARAHVADPSSGVQIPIPLHQTDFDLVPAGLPSPELDQRFYYLTSVPKKLVDQLLDCLRQAHLELHALDLAQTAQQRLLVNETAMLLEQERLLLLDLTRECSHLTVLTSQGEVEQKRLAAIRAFPDPFRTKELSEAALGDGLTAEAMVQADASYLPISELDVRVLLRELEQSIGAFEARYGARWKGMALTGVSSAHPLIAELLQQELSLPVRVIRPQAATGVGGVRYQQLMVQQSLTRLMGLGLRLMPEQTLNACALDRSDHEAFPSMPTEVPATTPGVLEKPVLGLTLSVADDEGDEENGFEGIGALRLPSEDEEMPSIQEVVAVEVEKEGDEESGFEGIGALRLPSEDGELTRIQSDNY